MPGPTSILDGVVNTSAPAPTGGGSVTPGPYSQATTGRAYALPSLGQQVGTAPLSGTHNTSLHVAGWGIGSLALIILMHKWGFRLVSVGKYGGR